MIIIFFILLAAVEIPKFIVYFLLCSKKIRDFDRLIREKNRKRFFFLFPGKKKKKERINKSKNLIENRKIFTNHHLQDISS